MNYPSIRIEGAILSPDILERLDDAPGQRPADFGLDGTSKVKDEIARAWADAQNYWRIYRQDSPGADIRGAAGDIVWGDALVPAGLVPGIGGWSDECGHLI